jgi:hypothetical protein
MLPLQSAIDRFTTLHLGAPLTAGVGRGRQQNSEREQQPANELSVTVHAFSRCQLGLWFVVGKPFRE